MPQKMRKNQDQHQREVLEFDHGVAAYPPGDSGGYWRIRWEESRRRRDTTAKSRSAAIAKATEIVERLARSTPTELGRARGADLVAHYLDPQRRPPRVHQWSEKHRDDQTRYCELYVRPVIGEVPCRDLSRTDFQTIIDQARTASVAQHLRRCLTGLVGAGLEEGYLLVRQDVLRGVRWQGELVAPAEPADHAVTQEEIPTTRAVHSLAAATAERTGIWWRELQILLVAYSGVRWGEHVALRGEQIDLERRRVRVDRQVIETRSALKETLPKGRRRRTTMFPTCTPGGVDLDAMVRRRMREIDAGDLLFPAPRGGWARRSNYGRFTWDPAAEAVGWPRGGRSWLWTFHSLRHVFATWALHEAGIPVEDLSRLMGHSSTRVTQDIYIHVRGDMFDRFFEATG
jgi:integrase